MGERGYESRKLHHIRCHKSVLSKTKRVTRFTTQFHDLKW